MGGTSLLRPRTLHAIQESFNSILETLGAKNDTPEEQLDKLLTTPVREFAENLGRNYALGPIVDDNIIPEMTSYESLGDKNHLVRFSSRFASMQKASHWRLPNRCKFEWDDPPYSVLRDGHYERG